MMNPDTGTFSPITTGKEAPKGWLVFQIGEEVIIKGHAFRVKRIKTKSLHLEPVVKQLTKES